MSGRESYERAAYLAALIARKSDLPAHLIARHVTHLQRIARQAVNSAVNLCNVPDYQERHDRKMESLRKHGYTIVEQLNKAAPMGSAYNLALGGDPRGPCCWLKIPGERGDGMDPDSGFAVY